MEQADNQLLPNFRKKTKPNISSLILKEIREQGQSGKLGSSHRCLLPNSEIRELPPQPECPTPNSELLPNSEIREQLENGETIAGKSIVTVKGNKYILTHANSDKYMPEQKGWREIKTNRGKLYLYLRWRDGNTQRSRCLGRVDRLS